MNPFGQIQIQRIQTIACSYLQANKLRFCSAPSTVWNYNIVTLINFPTDLTRLYRISIEISHNNRSPQVPFRRRMSTLSVDMSISKQATSLSLHSSSEIRYVWQIFN